MKIKTLICAGLAAISLSAHAGLQVQLNGGTNNFATTVSGLTNSYALYGDTTGNFTNGVPVASTGPNSFIDCSKTAAAVPLTWSFQAINTGSAAGTITFRVAGAVTTGAGWTNNYTTQTYLVAATSTNYVTLFLNVSNAPPMLQMRSVEMPATANATITLTNLYFGAFTKNGV